MEGRSKDREKALKLRHLLLPRPGPGRGGFVEFLGWVFYAIGLLSAIAGLISVLSGIAFFLVFLVFPLFVLCRVLFYLLSRR